MAKKIPALVQLSTAELKRLLAARERIDVLEKEKARLLKELAVIERELAQLLTGATGSGSGKKTRAKTAKKSTRKKAARKTAGKKTAKKKTTKKKTAKKTTKKKTAKKTAAKKTTRKKTTRKKTAGGRKGTTRAPGAGRVRLEDVIVGVLKKAGGPLPFKQLHDAIVDGKLFHTRSQNFDNVLRRTLSTSDAVKRVGRGVYDVA